MTPMTSPSASRTGPRVIDALNVLPSRRTPGVEEGRHPLAVEQPLEVRRVQVAALARGDDGELAAGEVLRAPAQHVDGRGAGPQDAALDVDGQDAVV